MTTVYVEADMPLEEGQEFMVYSTRINVGQQVKIGRYVGPICGKPIASGVCTETGDVDPRSPVTPTTGGKVANAWRNYRKIRVERIF